MTTILGFAWNYRWKLVNHHKWKLLLWNDFNECAKQCIMSHLCYNYVHHITTWVKPVFQLRKTGKKTRTFIFPFVSKYQHLLYLLDMLSIIKGTLAAFALVFNFSFRGRESIRFDKVDLVIIRGGGYGSRAARRPGGENRTSFAGAVVRVISLM